MTLHPLHRSSAQPPKFPLTSDHYSMIAPFVEKGVASLVVDQADRREVVYGGMRFSFGRRSPNAAGQGPSGWICYKAEPLEGALSKSVYQQLVDAGVPLDSHESDLYAKVTPESKAIVDQYEFRTNVTTFQSQTDGGALWYNIPFSYGPFWEKKV